MASFWSILRTFWRLFLRRFFDASLGGLLAGFWSQLGRKWAPRGTPDVAKTLLLLMFREGPPFLQKVGSESAPGRQLEHFGANLEPVGRPFGRIFPPLCPPILHAIFDAISGKLGLARWRHGGGPAEPCSVLAGLGRGSHTPCGRPTAWRGGYLRAHSARPPPCLMVSAAKFSRRFYSLPDGTS